MSCNNEGGFFGRSKTPDSTKIGLFYGICIPIRISLGLAVWFLAQKNSTWAKIIASLTLIASVFSMVSNGRCLLDKTVWWNRKVHLFSAVVLAILSILALCGVIDTKYLALVIWLDLSWGFFDKTTSFIE